MSVRFPMVLARAAGAAPHVLLVVVSALFTAVFFRELGQSAGERAIYLALAVALEAAKVHFLWHLARAGIGRFARATVASRQVV